MAIKIRVRNGRPVNRDVAKQFRRLIRWCKQNKVSISTYRDAIHIGNASIVKIGRDGILFNEQQYKKSPTKHFK